MKITNRTRSMALRISGASIALIMLFSVRAQGQTIDNIRWSPEGVMIFLADRAIGAGIEGPVQGYLIKRAEKKDGPYTELGRAEMAANAQRFRAIAGDAFVDELRAMKKLPSDEALFSLLRARPMLEQFGLHATHIPFLLATGAAWRDVSNEARGKGRTFYYKVLAIRKGAVENEGPVGVVETGTYPLLPVFRIAAAPEERDSSVTFIWAVPAAQADHVLRASVYAELNGGDFRVQPAELFGTRKKDSLVFSVRVSAPPASRLRAFLRPLDLLGNAGPHSDTLQGFTIDWLNIPLLAGVESRDSSAGILLTWKPLPRLPHIVGVTIARSTQPATDYTVLDTAGADAVSYLDMLAAPNKTYYYRLSVLTTRGVFHEGSGQTTASHLSPLPPVPPSGVSAAQEGRNVRLRWDPVPEGDLFAYFVYRGTGPEDSMLQVSSALTEPTFLDTSATLDGRFTYAYCVRAINRSQNTSEASSIVFARPLRPKAPPAPLGISAMPMGSRVRLTWTDMTRVDPLVRQYRLYRRGRLVPGRQTKDAQQRDVDTSLILIKTCQSPPADDSNVVAGHAYQYAVSMVNSEGLEGPRSLPASVKMPWPPLPTPDGLHCSSTEKGVMLRWNPVLHSSLTGYAIYRRNATESEAQWLATVHKTDTQYLDTYTAKGIKYYYSVTATAASGEGDRCLEKVGRR